MSDFTEKVIAVVQKYSILYDVSHPEYKNIRKKDKVWNKIGLELDKSGEDVKKKWRNLRDTYIKYLRSIQTKTRQNSKKNYRHWQWAKQMAFFRPFLSFASTDSNIGDLNAELIISEYDIPEMEQRKDILDSPEQEDLVESSEFSFEQQIANSQSTITTPSHSTQKLHYSKEKCHQNLKREQKNMDEHHSPVTAVDEYLENKRSRGDRTATDLIFAGYAKTVNSFGARRQAITRMKIAQIIAEQELQHIEEIESKSRFSSSSVNLPDSPRPIYHSPSPSKND